MARPKPPTPEVFLSDELTDSTTTVAGPLRYNPPRSHLDESALSARITAMSALITSLTALSDPNLAKERLALLRLAIAKAESWL